MNALHNTSNILSSIIGEDKFMSIKVGAEAGESSEDVIAVRGPTQDVDRVVKEILKIVESAKNDEIVNSYVSLQFASNDFTAHAVFVYTVYRVRH